MSKRGTGPVYDVRLLGALRRVAELERERATANVAINGLLQRCVDLERRLAGSEIETHAAREQFRAYLRCEIEQLSAENHAIDARIAALHAGRLWRIGVLLRAVRGRLRRRG